MINFLLGVVVGVLSSAGLAMWFMRTHMSDEAWKLCEKEAADFSARRKP